MDARSTAMLPVVAIVVLAAVAVAALYLVYPWWCRRRTTPAEALERLPGDDLVADGAGGYTLAVSIAAPPSRVWPWLVQIGQGRGGFYTHEWVERALGADIHNVDALLPELQHLAVGDTVRLTPDPYLGRPGQSLSVAEVTPPRALVLRQTLPDGTPSTWAYVLRPAGERGTRLLFRRRGASPALFDRIARPGYLYMDVGMLAGIRRRAERADV